MLVAEGSKVWISAFGLRLLISAVYSPTFPPMSIASVGLLPSSLWTNAFSCLMLAVPYPFPCAYAATLSANRAILNSGAVIAVCGVCVCVFFHCCPLVC